MATNGSHPPRSVNGTLPHVGRPPSCDVKGFHVVTRKRPILPENLKDVMADLIKIPVPEMTFGDNVVAVEYPASKWGIKFDALGALDRVDKTGEKRLKVAYSKKWHESRVDTDQITEVVRPFDWSYTTDYKGDVAPDGPQFQDSTAPIPYEVLRRPDPLLVSEEVLLYEDELADNGVAKLVVRIRVMPAGLFILSRFFMRLDNVLLRLRDTRVYVDFDKREAIREYIAREKDYETVRADLVALREDVIAQLDNPERMAQMLPVVEKTLENANLAAPPNSDHSTQSITHDLHQDLTTNGV